VPYSFRDDYSDGAHPEVLAALVAANAGQEIGYGLDEHSVLARERIRGALGTGDADVHFVVGGTQANLVALSGMLSPYEAVVATDTAHIDVHETGAIEATGHRIVTCPSADGKLTPDAIEAVVAAHHDEHRVRPGAVSIAQATELGTVYTHAELDALVAACRELGLGVYVDGARMGVALASTGEGLALHDLVRLGIDAFTLGGTKNGALCGEAIVVLDARLRPYFRWLLKQRGALVAQGRLLGAQFARLFAEDGLWFAAARRANATAARLADGLGAAGVALASPCETNQVFAVLPDRVAERLLADWSFLVWEQLTGERSVVRLVCSWATPDDRVDAFVGDVAAALG
jgi:threonine aldolase